ncbi:MAG: Cell differentiation protein RCD1 [Paramarteilia canceri]
MEAVDEGSAHNNSAENDAEMEKTVQLIRSVIRGECIESDSKLVDKAIISLAKKRESVPDLAPLLWHTPGLVTVLVMKVTGIYKHLKCDTLTRELSSSVCNALALLQVLASHSETRLNLLESSNF